MPDIRESVQIDAPPSRVHPFISSASGFSKWWAEDVTLRTDTVVDLGFFNRATIYSLQLVRTAAPAEAEWLCSSGKEWKGTKLLFQLSEREGQTQLRFTHANWEADTDYFVSCNTTWGALMFRLKAAAEGKKAGPLFSMTGWAL
jgi:uncharacterized protein YndB with AHSA1/START domain